MSHEKNTPWSWYVGGPLFAIFLLYLPWLLMLAETVVFETDVVFEGLYAVGLIDVLEPIYDHTIDRILE